MAKTGKAYSKQSVKKTGRERKEKLVAGLVEKLDSSNGLVFTEYKGITHQQLESLRKELKSVDASLLIAKNSLMKISLGKSKNFADYKDNENLEGSAATLFIGNDSVEPLKKLQKSIKDTGLPTIKFGVLEGQLLDEAGVIKLASLPSRDVLLAQFVGMLNSPIQGFVSGLNAIPQKFVMTLDAIAKSKPAAAEPAKSEDVVQAEEPSKPEPSSEPEASQDKPETEAPVTEESNETAETPTDDTTKPTGAVQDDSSAKPTDAVQDDSSAKPTDETETAEEETNEEKDEKGGEK